MLKAKPVSLSFWNALFLLVALNLVVFSVMIALAADDLRVRYIPDDAYYYLTLARNFSSLGLWTFDSGVSVTSGFHPLLAYLLSGTYSLLHPDENSFVTYGILLSLVFALASAMVLWFWGFRQKDIRFLIFLILIMSSQNFVHNTVSITEWSLILFITSLYFVWFFCKYQEPEGSFFDCVVLFALGFLGSIARSDSALLPFSIAVGVIVISLISSFSKRSLLFALTGLAGTLTGLLAVFAHNYLFTNEFLQSSAKMKAYWAQLGSPKFHAAPLRIGEILGLGGLLLLAVLVVQVTLPRIIKEMDGRPTIIHRALIFLSRHFLSSETQPALAPGDRHSRLIMIASASICLIGYFLFYARNAAVQVWYSANLIVPVLMFIYGISGFVSALLRETARLLVLLLFLITVIFNIAALYPIGPDKAMWPHQKFMRDAGIYLKEDLPEERIGSWNAGIIGYYEGGHVVNLDGLVNNDIYDYAVGNELPAYLESRDLDTIVDFEYMLADDSRRIRGGYDDPTFLESLQEVKVFDNGEYAFRYLTLYQIDQVDGPE